MGIPHSLAVVGARRISEWSAGGWGEVDWRRRLIDRIDRVEERMGEENKSTAAIQQSNTEVLVVGDGAWERWRGGGASGWEI